MIRVNIHDAKTNLSQYLARVQEGEVVQICNRNVPVAEIRSVSKKERVARPIGLYDGWFSVPDEAFAPLTDEELADWEKPIF